MRPGLGLRLAGPAGVVCGCLALMLSGCLVGPDYVRPAIPALESEYISGGDGSSSSVSTEIGPHDEWWTQFDDPKLRELVESAVANNQNLKAAYARVCESRSRFDLSTIGPWPQLNASSTYSRRNQRNPGFLNGVNSNGGPGFDAFSNGLSASWEIDLFGRLRRGIESQDAQWSASLNELRDVLVTVISDVATNYVELRVLQKRRAIALENVDVQERSFDIATQRFKAGLVGALDGRQAESVLWTTRALIPELEEQIQNRINRICILLGESPHAGMRTWLGEGNIPAPPGLTPGIPANLVSQRPDIRAAEQRMHAACAEIGVATADLYPRINLLGDLAYDALDVSQLFSNQAFYSIGPSIQWNLITLGRTRRNINIREAQRDESVAQFRQAVLQAVEEVENGLVGQRRRSERSQKLAKSAEAANDAYDLSLSTYEIGDSNFQRVLEAQRQLLNAQDSSIVARGNVTLSVIQTYRALGAGWRALEFTGQRMPENDETLVAIQFIPRRQRGAFGHSLQHGGNTSFSADAAYGDATDNETTKADLNTESGDADENGADKNGAEASDSKPIRSDAIYPADTTPESAPAESTDTAPADTAPTPSGGDSVDASYPDTTFSGGHAGTTGSSFYPQEFDDVHDYQPIKPPTVMETNPGTSFGGHSSEVLNFEPPDAGEVQAPSVLGGKSVMSVPYGVADEMTYAAPFTTNNVSVQVPVTTMPRFPNSGFSPNAGPRIQTEWPAIPVETRHPQMFDEKAATHSGNIVSPVNDTTRLDAISSGGFGIGKFTPPNPVAGAKIRKVRAERLLPRKSTSSQHSKMIRPQAMKTDTSSSHELPQLFPRGTGHAGPAK